MSPSFGRYIKLQQFNVYFIAEILPFSPTYKLVFLHKTLSYEANISKVIYMHHLRSAKSFFKMFSVSVSDSITQNVSVMQAIEDK